MCGGEHDNANQRGWWEDLLRTNVGDDVVYDKYQEIKWEPDFCDFCTLLPSANQ